MSRVVVTKSALREFISDLIGGSHLTWQTTGDVGNFPVGVSGVVDPSAAQTDPGNEKFVPQNRAELRSAMSSMIDDMSDDDVLSFYNSLLDAVDGIKNKEKKMDDVKKVEQIIRSAIRKMLSEAELPPVKKIPPGVHGAEYMRDLERRKKMIKHSLKSMPLDEPEEAAQEEPTGRKNIMMTDVGGASFKDIAKEMGYASESGAKQAVEKALEKARFASSMDPDDLEILVLTAMNDYVAFLNKSGELTAADVELLKSHPEIVSDLEGFREFLNSALKKAQRAGQKVVDPVKED